MPGSRTSPVSRSDALADRGMEINKRNRKRSSPPNGRKPRNNKEAARLDRQSEFVDYASHRESLKPLWVRIQEHEKDLRDLYRASTQAQERVSSANETIDRLRQEIRDLREQSLESNKEILKEIQMTNTRLSDGMVKLAESKAAHTSRWDTFKTLVPMSLAITGLVLSGLTLMSKLGII